MQAWRDSNHGLAVGHEHAHLDSKSMGSATDNEARSRFLFTAPHVSLALARRRCWQDPTARNTKAHLNPQGVSLKLEHILALLAPSGEEYSSKIDQSRTKTALTAPASPASRRRRTASITAADHSRAPSISHLYQDSLSSSLSSFSSFSNYSPREIESASSAASESIFVGSLLQKPGLRELPMEDYVPADDITVSDSDSKNMELGNGGQARIFRARVRGEWAAIKVSHDFSILQEYSIIRKLAHPDIVRPIAFSFVCGSDLRLAAFDAGASCSVSECSCCSEDSDFIYMACYECADNGDLATYLSKHPHRRTDHRFLERVFDSILSAMEHLHKHGFLHCDIKPENVLITKSEKAKLADFGMCQEINDHMVPQGTPSYMAPEILTAWFSAKALHTFSPAVDTFAFGVLIIRAVTDQYPFKRITARLRHGIRFSNDELDRQFATPQLILHAVEHISPNFAVLAKLCIRSQPDERPTAEYLRHIFQDLLTSQDAPPMPSLERIGRQGSNTI